MNTQKKWFILSNGYVLSTDEKNCYLNDCFKCIDSNGAELGGISLEEIKQKKEELMDAFYSSFFQNTFKNIVVLTAAGTSMDNGVNKGKTRDGLWSFCENEIKAITDRIKDLAKKECYINKDIEAFLSFIILYEKLHGKLVNENKESLLKAVEMRIKEACSLLLDKQNAPHINFLNKITARKASDPRVQLFTTNYDTLFEQAASEAGFVVIDGFDFTYPRKFSGRNFDYDIVNRERTRLKSEESYISKVFHLYKLHGSLNWEKNEEKVTMKEDVSEPHIIYPASDKYESSYEQPYFEMMSRFQQSLRKEGVLMIVVGFGFQDKHIQNVIIEAVEQNPSFHLVIVNYSGDSESGINLNGLEKFTYSKDDNIKVKRNVTILHDTFSGFTEKYPENKTYIKKDDNETI